MQANELEKFEKRYLYLKEAAYIVSLTAATHPVNKNFNIPVYFDIIYNFYLPNVYSFDSAGWW
jgi:hypothetical protein